ncbi:MAG: asparagine synthase (glutamine-hydrolyzing) [Gammaproteobacteria bacterium]|nr:asparagine synthase (glutamine-hydrolyzing) [Gammaproteobacteria bacterium]
MCGFTGFMQWRDARPAHAREALALQMAESLYTRGPDDAGAWADPSCGYAVGFRRLSIIDRSPNGHQPMVSSSGRFVIAFNGEAYNAPELRPDLAVAGIEFRGHSDTEVVLESCALHGVEATVSQLIGMFAFALWDREERCLHLVRDRMGIKPLYYGNVNQTLFFGSQPKSFVAHPDWSGQVDRGALAAFTRFGYVPAGQSIYAGLQHLPPGHLARIDAQGKVQLSRYWDLPAFAFDGFDAARSVADDERAEEQFEALLMDAVKLRMVADVPLGAFLSGGVDSSLVVALMQAQSAQPVKTFSIGFHELGFDEAPHAKAVAEHLGTEHYELYVGPQDALDLIPNLSEWYDEPFSDSSQIPTCLVSRMARDHVTVCLSGDGGDELFAGYTRYRIARHLWLRANRLPPPVMAVGRAVLRSLGPSVWGAIGKLAGGGGDRLRLGSRVPRLAQMLEPGRFEWLYRDLVSQWHDPVGLMDRSEERVDPCWDGSLREIEDIGRRAQVTDMLTYLPGDILTKVDRASMAVALEARVPLIDHRVVEASLALPQRFAERGETTKWLLRRMLYKHVPRELIERPKMGFGVPIDSWLRGPLRDWAEDLLNERKLAADGYFNPAPVRQRWREHLDSTAEWHYPLWAVLMFQDWKRRWSVA